MTIKILYKKLKFNKFDIQTKNFKKLINLN